MKHYPLIALSAVMILLAASAGEVRAQLDLNAGKSGAQMFASNCTTCHRSPAGLARGRDPRSVARFLLEHYTARPENAGAIASYLASVRGTAPPARASDPTEPAAAAAPTVRQRPLDKITNATVDRLKTFASAGCPAAPSDPNTPPRGVARLEAYAATGAAPGALRQTAISAALRAARSNPPARAAAPGEGAPAEGGNAAEGATATIVSPAPADAAAVLQLQGPPASGARPSRQSNGDQF